MGRMKGCLVSGCSKRRTPNEQLCSVHRKTHEVVMEKCTGEAHSNPFIDNCWGCAPYWGEYPVARPKPTQMDKFDPSI